MSFSFHPLCQGQSGGLKKNLKQSLKTKDPKTKARTWNFWQITNATFWGLCPSRLTDGQAGHSWVNMPSSSTHGVIEKQQIGGSWADWARVRCPKSVLDSRSYRSVCIVIPMNVSLRPLWLFPGTRRPSVLPSHPHKAWKLIRFYPIFKN